MVGVRIFRTLLAGSWPKTASTFEFHHKLRYGGFLARMPCPIAIKADHMRLTVELFGYMRALAKAKQVEVDVVAEATLHDVLDMLVGQYPELRSTLSSPDLPEWFVFYLQDEEGHYRASPHESRLQENAHILQENAHILLVPTQAGG